MFLSAYWLWGERMPIINTFPMAYKVKPNYDEFDNYIKVAAEPPIFGSSDGNIMSIRQEGLHYFGTNTPLSSGVGTYFNIHFASFQNATSIGLSAFRFQYLLKSVYLPNCSYVGTDAFQSCSNLEVLIFYKDALQFGYSCFQDCVKLEQLWLMGNSVAKAGSYMFIRTPMSDSSYLGHFGSIYVPASLLNDYITAKNWSLYSKRFVGF